jgi:hypothetical protein
VTAPECAPECSVVGGRRSWGNTGCDWLGGNLANSVCQLRGRIHAAFCLASEYGLDVRWEPAGPDGPEKIIGHVRREGL